MSIQFFIGLVTAIAIGVWIGNNHKQASEVFSDIIYWILPKLIWVIGIIAFIGFCFYLGAESFTDILQLVIGLVIFFIVIWALSLLDSLGRNTFIKVMLGILVLGLLAIWIFVSP